MVALGGRLTPKLLIEAYSKGIFPWSGEDPVPWYSPDPRLILEPQKVHISKSMRKMMRRGGYTVRFDRNFQGVMMACAATPRPEQDGTWICARMIAAYGKLHEQGIAHCVEVELDGRLAGGLYGLTLGRFFFGESMFAWQPNASKLALIALCQRLAEADFELIDCQQETGHLKSMGAEPIPRARYLSRLERSLLQLPRHRSWSDWDEVHP